MSAVSTPTRIAIYAALCICLTLVARQLAPAAPLRGVDRRATPLSEPQAITGEQRDGTFRFAAGSSVEQQQIFLNAVASARPEARRLVELVDGLVTVHFDDPPGESAIGLTQFDGTGYAVSIDLGAVVARYGVREANAIVLHELGHVVDGALVSDELVAELDRDIPIGENCQRDGPAIGACAPIAERFADSFSKWAMDDLGVNLASGYRILPPVPLEKWGRPLTRLGT
jgi:hypothetical protein